MSKKTVVFVTKDVGGFNVACPVAQAIKDTGKINVQIIAEGVSAERWKGAGWDLFMEGPKNFKETPDTIDEKEFIGQLSVGDVVVTTMGSPINLEDRFGRAANSRGITLVTIEDVWGSFTRSTAIPQLLFTLDAFGEKLIRSTHEYDEAVVMIVGNPAVSNLVVPEDLRARIECLRLRYGRLVLFCGEGDGTGDLLRVALCSLLAAKAKEDMVLIPRFHPKHIGNPVNRANWNGMLDLFELCSKPNQQVLCLNDVKNTDALAALCDITISGASTTLQHAAKNGRIAVAIETELTKSLLAPQVGGFYDRFPGVYLGYALPLLEPSDHLFQTIVERQEALRANAQKAFVSVSPDIMAERILSL